MDKSLIDYLKQIPDHRDPYGLRHPLWLVLLMIIMGIMSGYWGYRQLGRIGSRHRRELISRLKIPKARVPSYSVMRRVMVDLDYKELQKIFNQWSIESSLIPASEWISVDALHCQKADATPRRRQAQTPVPSSRRQSLQRGEPPQRAALGTLSAFAHGGNPRRESGISCGLSSNGENPSISSRKDRNASPTDWLGNAHQAKL